MCQESLQIELNTLIKTYEIRSRNSLLNTSTLHFGEGPFVHRLAHFLYSSLMFRSESELVNESILAACLP